MGFNYYQIHHLHENVYSKNHIDSELNKKPNHADVDTKVDEINHCFMHCLFNKEVEHQKILFCGTMTELLVPYDIVIKEVVLYVQETDRSEAVEKYSIVESNALAH